MSGITSIQKSVRQKKLICQFAGTTVAILMIVAWVFLLIQPFRESREGLLSEQDSYGHLQSQVDQIRSNHEQAKSQLNQWKQRNKLRLERSASKLDTAEFLSWVNAHSETVGLVVRDFRPSGRESQPDYEGQCITLSGHGSFSSICQFLDQLRQCPRMNRITTVEIVPRDAERTMYQLTLGIVLYSFNPQVQKAQP